MSAAANDAPGTCHGFSLQTTKRARMQGAVNGF